MNQTSASTWPTGVYEFLSALNIFLSIPASLGNALILVALHKESSLHPPTKLLFRCLAVTDLCVGLMAQPLFAVVLASFVTTAMNRKVIYYIIRVYSSFSIILCQVSVFTSTAISVDRLLALLLRVRYRHVVTLRRVLTVIIFFCLIGILCVSMYYWNSIIAFNIAVSLILLSIATSVFSYMNIYFKLRHHQLQNHIPQKQPKGGRVPLNTARYKKSVFSALWVQIALACCYVPHFIMVMLMTYGQMAGNTFGIAYFLTTTLTYLNSSLNPILYCWRIRTVRKAAKDTIKQLNCCKSA